MNKQNGWIFLLVCWPYYKGWDLYSIKPSFHQPSSHHQELSSSVDWAATGLTAIEIAMKTIVRSLENII
jgi:hypothetical protein